MQHGPFLEPELDLWSERPWCVPSWQLCLMVSGKWGGKGDLWVEEKHSPWSGWAGSCEWLQQEAALEESWIRYSAAFPVLDTFPQGAGTGADGTKHVPVVGPGSLLQCCSLSNTPVMRGPAPHSRSRSLGPCNRGPETPVCVNSSVTGYFNSSNTIAEDGDSMFPGSWARCSP